MDNAMIVIFSELHRLEDLVSFSGAYKVTLALRCTIVSFFILAIVMFLRETILKNTVFLKGLIWSLFLLVPFFGKLKAYYSIKFLAKPSMLCQAVAISYPWFPAVYIIVAGILIFRFIRDLRGIGKLLEEAEPLHMGKANVWVTVLPISPCSFGLFSPRILIPRALTEELTDKELETIIIHERTHIRLGHLWIFSIWEIFSSLFWMNPLLRFSFRYLRADMEEICDRVTIAHSGNDPAGYGELILKNAAFSVGMRKRLPAMFIGGNGKEELKRRCVKIADYIPYSKSTAWYMTGISAAMLIAAFIAIVFFSYPNYEILPDITVTDDVAKVYVDWNEVKKSGAIERKDGKFLVDAKKLRTVLPGDFPRNKYIYFYYDAFMKIPGMGGGSDVAWLEDVPEEGVFEAVQPGRDFKDDISIWIIKYLI